MMIGMIAVILSLISSYHNVQLGQWELVGRQNLIIGNSNKKKLLVLLEHRTIKSNNDAFRGGACGAGVPERQEGVWPCPCSVQVICLGTKPEKV